MPWFRHLILAVLMVAMPAGGQFGAQLDEEHEREDDRPETIKQTIKQVANKHRPGEPLVFEYENAPLGVHQGFNPTFNPRGAELSLRGATERRML